ncbi:MAG: hypothetical protein K6A23_09400 [Butyrivibrio sp.]|nr:hypothetical protein [Butyrivibrio sp.]
MIGFNSWNEMADIHSHILPYVDDGAEDMEVSSKLIQEEYAQGVRLIVLTVHLRLGMFDTPISRVMDHYNKLQNIIKGDHYKDLTVLVSREYFCDDRFMALLDGFIENKSEIIFEDKIYVPREEIIPFGIKNCILLEFSSTKVQREEFKFFIQKCIKAGLSPVIAHVERYPAVWNNPDIVTQFKKYGAYIQVNADAILGKESKQRNVMARELVEKGLADIVSSDAHDLEYRVPNMKKCYRFLKVRYGKAKADMLMHDNASFLIKG